MLQRSLRIRPTFIRRFAHLPVIDSIEASRENGIPGLYSKAGLNTVWYDKCTAEMELLKEALQAPGAQHLKTILLPGTTIESEGGSFQSESTQTSAENLLDLVNKTSTDIKNFQVNLLASNIFNSYFATSCLRTNSTAKIEAPGCQELLKTPSTDLGYTNEPTGFLRDWIVQSFGSIVEFRTLFLNTNLAIKGNGYTWLVARESVNMMRNNNTKIYDSLFIVNTYNGGSPIFHSRAGQVSSFAQQEAVEQQEEKPKTSMVNIPTLQEAQNSHGVSQHEFKPLLAINGSPSAYLPDYGVFGKKLYLNNLWQSINWDLVEQRLPSETQIKNFTVNTL